MGSPIETLFGYPGARLLAESWTARPCHAAGPVERLGELASHPALRDIPALLRARPGAAQLHVRRPEGTAHLPVDPDTAVARFEAGGVLDVRDLQRWLPPVRAWFEGLLDELALRHAARSSYCHAFVSPAGTGVAKHFDNREVIAVQLRGRKQWWVARNDALPRPLMPHNAGDPIHPLNRGGAAGDLDDPAMPADAATYVLEPGGVLFVPRGWWHATHALEDSLSLSFGFRAPSWVERFAERALAELAGVPGWRAPAFDVRSAPPAVAEPFVRAMHEVLRTLRAAPPRSRAR